MALHRWIISGDGEEFIYDFGWNGDKVLVSGIDDAKSYIQTLQTSYQKHLNSTPLPKQSIGLDKNTIENLREDVRLTFVNFLTVKDNQYRMLQVFGALENRSLLHPDVAFDETSLVHDKSLTPSETRDEYARVVFSFLLVSAHKLSPTSFDKYAGQNELLLSLIQSYDAYRSYIELRDSENNESLFNSTKGQLTLELDEIKKNNKTVINEFEVVAETGKRIQTQYETLEARAENLDKSLTDQIDAAIAASRSEALTHSAAELWQHRVWFSYAQSVFGFTALGALFYYTLSIVITHWERVSAYLDVFTHGQLFRPTVLMAGVAALTAFFTLARIFYRVTVSGLEMAADADERRALVRTFIALEGEGMLSADQDRELILRALFRPGPSSGTDHEPSLSLIDALISKLTAK